MNDGIDWGRVALVATSVLVAFPAAYFGQPLIHNNSDAINIIVTVFSILAGFLIAIIAIVGDPVLLPPGTWRAAEQERGKLTRRLVRHKWLFLLYLITLGLIFVAVLLKSTNATVSLWLERAFLFFAACSFFLSMILPGSLMKVQRERIDAVIEHRKSEYSNDSE